MVLGSRFFDHQDAKVIFQGGEPTLVGKEALEAYMAEIREVRPHAHVTAVTNLFSARDWLPGFARDHFDNRLETTWARHRKTTLAGSEARYQAGFRSALRKMIASGVHCPVNVELNRETAAAGPDCIIDLHRATGATQFEFDVSADFAAFRQEPEFLDGHYPVPPLTLSYAGIAAFRDALAAAIEREGLTGVVKSNILETGPNISFNIVRERHFLTLNPDGILTTNPLFSDTEETWLGNVFETPMAALLAHPDRHARILHETRRLRACIGCPSFQTCRGGPSHVPVFDGSGYCAGFRADFRTAA